MPYSDNRAGPFRFGVFGVDPASGELTKRGMRVSLQEQPLRLLVMLLERPGQIVTRDELRSKLWPQTTVDFDRGLNKAVGKIREALGDSAENPRFVETIAGRGYRFLADVTVVRTDPPQADGSKIAEPDEVERILPSDPIAPAPRGRGRNAQMIFVATSSAAIILAVGVFSFQSLGVRQPAPIRSLAVLPLENLSADPSQDYFVDGMTEELITDLGQISALRVISRTSAMTYKNTRKSLPSIARELNVEAVVEGSVLRSADNVRITAQLIEAAEDKHLWAQSFEGDIREMLTLQSRVASSIADQIRVTLNLQEKAALEKSDTVNPDAFQAYLKGRFFWNKRTADGLKRAIEFFKTAIDEDPEYAQAYSGLADAYALSGDWEYGVVSPDEALRLAKAAARRALAIDGGLGEAHTSLAFALDLYEWDWKGAEKEYKQAIKLSPGYSTLHLWFAWHLMVTGRTEEGIGELKKAESLDPLSLIVGTDLADALCIARQYDESERQSRKVLELDSNFAVAHYELGQTLLQKGEMGEAILEFEKAIAIAGHSGAFDSNLAYAYALTGRKADAQKILVDLSAASSESHSADANIALGYVGLGDLDRAMSWLERAYSARFNPSILLRPAWDPLRGDPRFKDLWRRLGLPA